MMTPGDVVHEFEQKFAEYCGANFGVATTNGTTALHAALLAAGVKPGDEVIVPAFTFFASASSVSMCGAKPVFADILPDTYNNDPKSIEEKITDKTKAVIGVHIFGQCCDVPVVIEIRKKYNLRLHRGFSTGAWCILKRSDSRIFKKSGNIFHMPNQEHDNRWGGGNDGCRHSGETEREAGEDYIKKLVKLSTIIR